MTKRKPRSGGAGSGRAGGGGGRAAKGASDGALRGSSGGGSGRASSAASGGDASMGGADRALRVRVKTARGRKLSSKLWLERQLNDPYVARAKREGYRSRAAYKLLEIQEKRRLLRPGARVVDLGAAPGGWTQVAVAAVGADRPDAPDRGFVLGVDILAMDPIPGATLLQLDFLEPGADETVKRALGGEADLVLSDMAAPATGHKQTDHIRIVALCEAAAEFAFEVLSPGGAFLAKVLQGGAEGGLLALLKRRFASVAHIKPPASRADSAETYVLATGYRGEP